MSIPTWFAYEDKRWNRYNDQLASQVEKAYTTHDPKPIHHKQPDLELLIYPLQNRHYNQTKGAWAPLHRGLRPRSPTSTHTSAPAPVAVWEWLSDAETRIPYDSLQAQELERAFNAKQTSMDISIGTSRGTQIVYNVNFETSWQINKKTGRRRDIFRDHGPCSGDPTATFKARSKVGIFKRARVSRLNSWLFAPQVPPHWSHYKPHGVGSMAAFDSFSPLHTDELEAGYSKPVAPTVVCLTPSPSGGVAQFLVVNFQLSLLIDILSDVCQNVHRNGIRVPPKQFAVAGNYDHKLCFTLADNGNVGGLYLELEKLPRNEKARWLVSRSVGANKETPLHVAARKSHLACALLLLKSGAIPDILDGNGLAAAKLLSLPDHSQSAIAPLIQQQLSSAFVANGQSVLLSKGFQHRMNANAADINLKLPPLSGMCICTCVVES